MEIEELNAEQKRLAGIKRAGEAVGQVLNLQGQNLTQSSPQLENTEALQKSAKAMCVAAAKGKGAKGDPADKTSCGQHGQVRLSQRQLPEIDQEVSPVFSS
eukprot:9492918-Pyramimonas_sp.AAC.1